MPSICKNPSKETLTVFHLANPKLDLDGFLQIIVGSVRYRTKYVVPYSEWWCIDAEITAIYARSQNIYNRNKELRKVLNRLIVVHNHGEKLVRV
jgi:hypothetical protein